MGILDWFLTRKKTLKATARGADPDPGDQLKSLATRAWELHRKSSSCRFVLKPSIPILFFGDDEAFARSRRRIITVGKNPSAAEFPSVDPFLRFPGVGIDERDDGEFLDRYLQALRGYFVEQPYRLWFGHYEAFLNGLRASYYSAEKYCVLHTDICSPLATEPAWSALSEKECAKLEDGGVDLWHRLVRHLRPHIIVMSVAAKHLDKIRFEPLSDWTTIYTFERSNHGEYPVQHRRVRVFDEFKTHLLFAPATQTPFGVLSHAEKRQLGELVEPLCC